MPTPPPTHATLPNFSTSVGLPRGPTTSARRSPTSSLESLSVVVPTTWKTISTAPRPDEKSMSVNGIRSPFSSVLMMTNWPAAALRVTSGA